jgi:DNA-binding MarR family transcriptional regulator
VPSEIAVDAETVARLRSVVCQLSRRFNAAARGAGLTPTQMSVLGSIASGGPIGVGALAEVEDLNATMVSRVVGKLADAGLIDRVADNRDRRVARVSVTTAGREALVQVRAERSRAILEAIERMDGADAEAVLEALDALESLARQFGIATGSHRAS